MDRDNTIARLENIAKHAVHTAGEDTFILSLDDGLAIHEAIEALKAQLTHEGTTSDMISRQDAIDALNEYFARIGKLKRRGLTEGEKAISLDTVGTIKTLPPVQPEPAIPLSWIEKYIEWLKSFDNEFANLEAAHISVMVKKWRKEQDETN